MKMAEARLRACNPSAMQRVSFGILATGLCVALAAGCGGDKTATASPPPPPSTVATPPAGATASPSARPSRTGPRPFAAKVSKVTRATVKKSWHPGCPVGLGGLRLITMTYWGMDKKTHEGELVVNADSTGASSWSHHAYGHAVDLITCENPYVHPNGHIEHPRCVKYGNRKRHDPGLIHAGDKVVKAFRSIGWGW